MRERERETLRRRKRLLSLSLSYLSRHHSLLLLLLLFLFLQIDSSFHSISLPFLFVFCVPLSLSLPLIILRLSPCLIFRFIIKDSLLPTIAIAIAIAGKKSSILSPFFFSPPFLLPPFSPVNSGTVKLYPSFFLSFFLLSVSYFLLENSRNVWSCSFVYIYGSLIIQSCLRIIFLILGFFILLLLSTFTHTLNYVLWNLPFIPNSYSLCFLFAQNILEAELISKM